MMAQRKVYESPGFFAGVIIIAIGIILLLDRNGLIHARDLFRFWPSIIIAAGIAKLMDPSRDVAPRVLGGTLVVAGGMLLSNSLGYTHIGFGDVWPVFIIATGVLLVWRSLEGRRFGPLPGSATVRQAPAAGAHDSRWFSPTHLNHWAIFGGFERKFAIPDFEGGELGAIFGGCEIDLRQAGLKNGRAVLEATAIFGGIEIRVPETWEVVLRGTGVFGGYSDSTHPVPDPAARTGTLWVRGAAVFGGVEIKN